MLNKVKKISLTAILIITIIIGCNSSNTKSDPDTTANPGDTIQTANPVIMNIYLENSGSMFGYVSSDNDFILAVPSLALHCDLRSDQVNYSMLNAEYTPLGSELSDFLSKLNVIGMSCGSPETSDLNSMFKRMLDNAKNGEISILISDGIYSVSGTDTGTGNLLGKLRMASTLTQKNFIERLKDEDITTYLVKLKSHFNGSYFTYQDETVKISQSRPYYIWIIGTQEDLQENFSEDYFENLPGFQNIVKFVKLPREKIKCQYVLHNPIGKIKIHPDKPTILSHVRPRRKDSITQFSIAFDFSNIPYSKDYFMNKNIYHNSLDYNIEEVAEITTLSPTAMAGLIGGTYTHVVTFSKSSSPWGDMIIEVKDIIPDWIEETHDEDDSDIIEDTNHTLGFKYLINGIAEAYDYINNSEDLFKVTFTITYK